MKYKVIETYSDFILNETLKTIDIDKTIEKIDRELSLMKVNFNIEKLNNKIKFEYFPNKNNKELYDSEINYIQTLFLDRFGWFPSTMEIINNDDKKYINKYNKNFIKSKYKIVKKITVIFEPKYDIEENIPERLYHLSIQQYYDNIIKFGLFPKSKSKKSYHLDRIYICKNVNQCYNLIKFMKNEYHFYKNLNPKNTINDKWIIYEINSKDLDIKMFKEPNYEGGYYIIDNIHPNRLKIYDKE